VERGGEALSQQLLTWKRATVELQWPDGGTDAAGRRLKRLVFARERQTGKQIATRSGEGRRTRPLVTMSAIMRHMPELRRSRVDRLTEALREYTNDTDRRVAEIVAEQFAETVEPRLEDLYQRDEKLAIAHEALAKQVNGISRAVSVISRRTKTRPRATTSDQG
jgi:hypothetical protein